MRRKVIKIATAVVTAMVTVMVAVLLTLGASDTKIVALAETGEEPGQYVQAYNQHNLIRFHVIANSDSDRDQALKRKVRDLIVKEMTPEFSEAKNLDQAREIAASHLEEIRSIAVEEVKDWGEDYPVSVQLGNFDFPVKSYGDLTLPAGNYEAVRVVIGDGQGANWWCVLFPPLCFVDVSRSMGAPEPEAGFANPEAVTAATVYKHGVEHENEYTEPVNQKEEHDNVKVRYKIIELFNGIFG